MKFWGYPNFPIHTCGADVLRMVEWQSLKWWSWAAVDARWWWTYRCRDIPINLRRCCVRTLRLGTQKPSCHGGPMKRWSVLPLWNVEQLKFSGNIDHAFEGRFNLFRLWKCMDPQKDSKRRVHFTRNVEFTSQWALMRKNCRAWSAATMWFETWLACSNSSCETSWWKKALC